MKNGIARFRFSKLPLKSFFYRLGQSRCLLCPNPYNYTYKNVIKAAMKCFSV